MNPKYLSYRFLFMLGCFLTSFTLSAQNLFEIIDNAERAIVTMEGYIDGRAAQVKSTGFVISADGLAICMGKAIYESDSIVARTRSNRIYKVERIVSTHPATNLTLIKLERLRQREFSYLLPAKKGFVEGEDALLFSHPDDRDDGVVLTSVQKIKYHPILNRSGIIHGDDSPWSSGAPLVNSKGQVNGVVCCFEKANKSVVFNSYLLNDTNWVSINKTSKNLKLDLITHYYLHPDYGMGNAYLLADEPIEAAKCFSRYLKVFPNHIESLCMRAQAREEYDNPMGRRMDLSDAIDIAPQAFLPFYTKGMIALKNRKNADAKTNFQLAIIRNPTYAPAIVEITKLEYLSRKDVRWAFGQYTLAILHDSICAKAYYEQSKLLMDYSSDFTRKIESLNQAIYLDPNLPGVYSIRGSMKFDSENFMDAIRDFDKAIEKDSKDQHAFFSRGVANYNIGLKEEACKDWNEAGKLGKYESYKYISRYCNNAKSSSTYDNR